jgi:hypothetical protein
MGHDAHWFSDIIGAALVGVGTTELLLHMHRYHEEHPWRLRVFPAVPPPGQPRASAPLGATIALDW